MERSYGQLSLEERCTIARLHEAGQSCRQIAAAVDRAASTISREMKRNRGVKVGYKPAYAAEQCWARRWRGSRLARLPELRAVVLERLAQGYSPEQVAGRLRLEQGRRVLSAESIYRFVYAQIRRTDDKGYHEQDFIGPMRVMGIAAHVPRYRCRRPCLLDPALYAQPEYVESQKKRKWVERFFGWLKTTANLAKTRHRGHRKLGWNFTLAAAAYNLVRMATLTATM